MRRGSIRTNNIWNTFHWRTISHENYDRLPQPWRLLSSWEDHSEMSAKVYLDHGATRHRNENLPASMYPGIHTSAAINADLLAKNPVQSILDAILYGISVWLTLPSVKSRTVIFACALPAHGRLRLNFVFLRSFIPVQHKEECTGSVAQKEEQKCRIPTPFIGDYSHSGTGYSPAEAAK